MKLYAHPFSSYCQKVLVALYENDTPFRFRLLEDAQSMSELEALWPMKRFPVLRDGDHVLIEASIIATIRDGPEIAEVIAFLRQKGFVVYDVLGGGRRPLDSALAQLDLLFVKEDSSLRADHRWSATA